MLFQRGKPSNLTDPLCLQPIEIFPNKPKYANNLALPNSENTIINNLYTSELEFASAR